jgi:putative FmdB family regulatory protein
MPTYAYRCTNPECAHTFDVVQAFTDDAITECPECGQPVRKVFSPVGVVFKGSGFYRNDSRGKTGSSEKADAKASSDSSSSGGEKSSSSEKSSGSSDSGSSSAASSSSTSSSGGSSSGSSTSSSSSSSSGSSSGSSSSGAKAS